MVIRFFRLSFLPLLAAIGLLAAGCGSTHTVVKPVTAPSPHQQSAASLCPPGQSHMGCASANSGVGATFGSALPTGAEIPDVSSFQGAVNWPAVKTWQRSHGWTPAGIFKLGEFVQDPEAVRNASQLHALGMWTAGYWFVRNTGCAHESAEAISVARALGVHIVVLDEEVPEAFGYDPCLTSALKHAGFIVVTYTAPGTWPGGPSAGNPAWIATYGPSFGCLTWTCKPVAWQFTDGSKGHPVFVPGVGTGDVSVDFGITKLGVPPVPVDLQHYARYPNVKWAATHSRERNTLITWDHRKCENPVRRSICKSSRAHMQLLLGRDQSVYRRQTRAQRDANHTPGRIQGLSHRLNGRGIVNHWL